MVSISIGFSPSFNYFLPSHFLSILPPPPRPSPLTSLSFPPSPFPPPLFPFFFSSTYPIFSFLLFLFLPFSILLSSPPPPFPFLLSPQNWGGGGGGGEKEFKFAILKSQKKEEKERGLMVKALVYQVGNPGFKSEIWALFFPPFLLSSFFLWSFLLPPPNFFLPSFLFFLSIQSQWDVSLSSPWQSNCWQWNKELHVT